MNRYDAGNTSKKENIELNLPVNSAYVSAARLTAASIAARIGFDIDETEDIKTAVSEACSFIIRKAGHAQNATFKISFSIMDGHIEIRLYTDVEISITSGNEADEMSMLMFKGLMDSTELTSIAMTEEDEPLHCLSMQKRHLQIDI